MPVDYGDHPYAPVVHRVIHRLHEMLTGIRTVEDFVILSRKPKFCADS